MMTWAISKYLKRKYQQILEAQKNPLAAQELAFDKLGLSPYRTYMDFINAYPVLDYKDVARDIEEQISNSQGNDIQFLAMSAGGQLIPLNSHMVNHFKSYQLSAAAILEAATDVQVYADKRIVWGSSPVAYSECGIPRGYISSFLSMNSPRFIEPLNYPSKKINQITNSEQKIQALFEETKNEDITYIAGVPTYLIQLFERIRSKTEIKYLNQLWPNLQTIVYSAMSIEPYCDNLNSLVGRELNYVGLYMATEGGYGFEIPELNKGVMGLYSLNLTDTVYSFRKNGSDVTLGINQLNQGDEVELLVSLPNGFINYATGDLIRVNRIFPTILVEIIGRTSKPLNMAIETMRYRLPNKDHFLWT